MGSQEKENPWSRVTAMIEMTQAIQNMQVLLIFLSFLAVVLYFIDASNKSLLRKERAVIQSIDNIIAEIKKQAKEQQMRRGLVGNTFVIQSSSVCFLDEKRPDLVGKRVTLQGMLSDKLYFGCVENTGIKLVILADQLNSSEFFSKVEQSELH